jgi:hypothetical protein
LVIKTLALLFGHEIVIHFVLYGHGRMHGPSGRA